MNNEKDLYEIIFEICDVEEIKFKMFHQSPFKFEWEFYEWIIAKK